METKSVHCPPKPVHYMLTAPDCWICTMQFTMSTLTNCNIPQIYTVSQKNWTRQSFENNFGKYGPILIILSLLQTESISHEHVIEFGTSRIVRCCITVKKCNHTLLHRNCWINLQCMQWFYCCYKAGNSGDISYLLSSWMMIHDVLMTSYWRH